MLLIPFTKQKNSNDRDLANKILNEFKLLPDSWSCCDVILSKSQCMYTKVFALGILEDVIKTKWQVLPEDQKFGLRNFLIDLLIKHVNDEATYANNSHFINKLNFIIVMIAKNEWTTTWPTFISEICTSAQTNQNFCENNLKLLQMMSEEINDFWKNSITTSKASELKAMQAKEFSSVFSLCCFIFENSENVKHSLLVEAVKLYAANIRWFPLEYVFKEDILMRFLNDLKTLPHIRVQIMKCLGEIFGLRLNAQEIGSEQYLFLKNLTLQIYKSYINQMVTISNETNFNDKYNKLDTTKKLAFEDFSQQFALSLISFFKNNFSYIQEFDFIIGTSNGNEFSATYMTEIVQGLNYITQITQIPNDEILKMTCEFWHWFSFKICFLKEKDIDPECGVPLGVYESSLQQYIFYTQESYYYKYAYFGILELVRNTLIVKMTKPIEVKIDVDEDGEIIMDQITNTIYQSLHETMRDSLIYLTHLDPNATEKIMLETLQTQTIESYWNPMLLNSLCWSIGCITGSMDEMHEKKFVVLVIKHLLNLCEIKKGKTNKAIVASNIMYVVGQYPRFLSAHWRFLKTVIKKLFEFMHELHPGVQDFACETFLKISIKCGDQLVIVNEGESEPYINVLVRSIKDDTADLQAHQKLMFYEAIGNMVWKEPDFKKQTFLIQNMLQPTYNDWVNIFEQANSNPGLLTNSMVIKAIDIIIKINEKVAASVKTGYWSFATYIYENLINTYMFYSNSINDAYNNNQYTPEFKLLKSIKKTILKFLTTMINSIDSQEIIMNGILPSLSNLIESYRYSHVENRDADVLLVFAAILERLKNTQIDYIVSIWNYLCLFTLEMIKSDFQSYPEHRINFFTLVKSLIANAFDALFQVQDSTFNKDALTAIVWAFRHDQPLMCETGLETLLILLKNINQIKISNGINVADPFYKANYFDLMQEVLCVTTDSFHKSGFNLQIEILQIIIQVVEFGQITENLFDSNMSNKDYTLGMLVNWLTNSFGHLNKLQIETFCLALFNKCYAYHDFKIVIRDFLTIMKSFSGNCEKLYEDEKKGQIEEAKALEERKRHFIPGMQPVYDVETQQKIHSSNYQKQNFETN